MKYRVTVSGRTLEFEVVHGRLVQIDGRSLYVDLDQVGGLPVYSLTVDDRDYMVFVEEGREDYQVEVGGRIYDVDVERQLPRLVPRRSGCESGDLACLVVSAPLAGSVVALPVEPGDRIEAGQVVAILESMKMQMRLTSPEPGVVESVHGLPGQDVGQGEKLVTLRVG
jgi:biotin carboxyl carrier protein